MDIADRLDRRVIERYNRNISLLTNLKRSDQVVEAEGFGSAQGCGFEHFFGRDKSLASRPVSRR